MRLKGPLKNTLAAGAADALSRVLGFAATAYLARVLGTSAFGMMSIGLSVLSYVVIFSSSGLQVMGVREVAATPDPRREWAGSVASLRCVLAILCIVIAGFAGFVVFGYSTGWLLTVLFVASALPMALLLDWYFLGKGRVIAVSASRVLMYCVYLALVYALVTSPDGILWTAVAFAAANWSAAIFLFLLFIKQVGTIDFVWTPVQWWELLKRSFPLGMSSVLGQTIANIPVLLVGALLSAHETGLFSASMKLIFFILMIDRVFYTLFFPVISRYRDMHKEEFPRLAELGVKFVLSVSIPVFVLGEGFAATIVAMVYGGGYEGAVAVLRWSLPYFLFTVTNTVLMCALYADHRETEFLRVMMIGTGCLVLLCALLSLLLGVEGTAIGLSAGEGLMTVLLFVRVNRSISLNLRRILAPAVTAGLVMGAGVLLTSTTSLFIVVPVAFLCFVIVLRLLGGLTQDDISFFRERFV